MSVFDELAAIGPQRLWEGVSARALQGERVTLAFVELEPGALVDEHAHEHEQVGIMLQGSFELRVGDETRERRRGDTWCIPPNVRHEARVGPEGAVLVEVWAPAREDWKAIEPESPRPLHGLA